MKREIIKPKVFTHTLVHFVAVVIFYIAALFFPLWAAVLLLVMHQVHMRVLKRCFLTRMAYHYNVMRGYTYWEYVSYLFGSKNYKLTGVRIDKFIKVTLLGILITRGVLLIFQNEAVASLLSG